MIIDLDKKEVIVLVSALDCYISELERRERQTDYLFNGYSVEKRKQLAEENKVLLSARLHAVHELRSALLGCPELIS